MVQHEERVGVLGEYLGFDGRRLAIFWGLVLGVVIAVTGIYVAIFGLDSWRSNMSQAGSMMLSNFDVPGAAASTTMGAAGSTQAAFVPGRGQTGAQYSCPNCGAVGLPRWSSGGGPRCPSCGAVMNVTARAGGDARLVAQP